MGKIKRGGYLFVTWVGDPRPRHVHVYRDGKLQVKWDLENRKVMAGKISRTILECIKELEREELL